MHVLDLPADVWMSVACLLTVGELIAVQNVRLSTPNLQRSLLTLGLDLQGP